MPRSRPSKPFTPGLCWAALVLLGLSAVSQAKTQQKPGLWEHTATVTMGGGFPQLDAAILAQLEAAGIELPFARPMTSRICLTPEQVAQTRLPDMSDADSGCSTRNVRREGDQVIGDVQCEGQVQGRGSLLITLDGPEHFTGVQAFEGTAQGLPVTLNTQMRGRWLGPDCGQVAPLGQ